jgi:phenylalanyl-tRNA synthetase alpha chain
MSLLDEVAKLEAEALERISQADSLASLQEWEIRYLGRKGPLTAILKNLKDLPIDERKAVGGKANEVRVRLEATLAERIAGLGARAEDSTFDPTLPGTGQRLGAVHILNQVMGDMCRVFYGMGFETAHGPHVETEYYNFEALNFAPDHPARDEQDTFFVEGGRLLRPHTTSVQPRELKLRKPPMKILMPGRTFRHEEITTRAHISFHQVDGFLVDEGVTVGDLKGTLLAFCRSFYGEDFKYRFRPSFFPFTEPSVELDISCFLCGGKGCQLCKFAGWLEVLGSGMIHPRVLEMAGYDSEKYTGFAFGMGVERQAMLKHKINDVRLFFNSNIRFLRQFV